MREMGNSSKVPAYNTPVKTPRSASPTRSTAEGMADEEVDFEEAVDLGDAPMEETSGGAASGGGKKGRDATGRRLAIRTVTMLAVATLTAAMHTVATRTVVTAAVRMGRTRAPNPNPDPDPDPDPNAG